MKSIKKFLAMIMIVGVMLPAASYPFTVIGDSTFDLGIYMGYGETEKSVKYETYPIGMYSGLTFGFTFIKAGIHFFSDSSVFGSEQFSRTSMGLEGRFMLSIPVLPIEPYVKAGFSFIDINVDMDVKDMDQMFFATYKLGAGLAVTFIPFIKPFGEYTIWVTPDKDGKEFKNYAINFGIQLSM